MEKEYKILSIVDPVGQKAGMDYYDIQLAKGLAKNGIKVQGYSNFTISNTEYSFKGVFKNHEVNNFKNKKNTIKGYIKAFYAIKRLGHDQVLLHLFSYSYLNLFVYSMAKLWGIRTYSIIHDVESLDGSGKNFIQNILLNKLINQIIVHNRFSLNILRENTALSDQKKVHIIPHGEFLELAEAKVDRKTARQKLGLESDADYFLFFGQIKQVKGLDLLLKAFYEVQKDKTYLIIAGRPWKDSFEPYQALIDELGIADKIIMDIQYISDEKRNLYFSASDFIILPYRKIFQSGVLLMAMSYGLPVIASDLDPNREIIENGSNGFLFESENFQDLRLQLEKVLGEDVEARKQVGRNAIITMKDSFSWRNIGREYSKIVTK